MKALGIRKFVESVREIEVIELEEPICGENDVKVDVHSVGINPSDYRMTVVPRDLPRNFPFILGSDFSGVIIEVGNNVKL